MSQNDVEQFLSFSQFENDNDHFRELDVFLRKVFGNPELDSSVGSAFYNITKVSGIVERSICFTARVGSSIVGMICFHLIPSRNFSSWFANKRVIRISSVLVHPVYRGIGVGRALVEMTERYGRFLSKKHLSIIVERDETDFRCFLDSLGFEAVDKDNYRICFNKKLTLDVNVKSFIPELIPEVI